MGLLGLAGVLGRLPFLAGRRIAASFVAMGGAMGLMAVAMRIPSRIVPWAGAFAFLGSIGGTVVPHGWMGTRGPDPRVAGWGRSGDATW